MALRCESGPRAQNGAKSLTVEQLADHVGRAVVLAEVMDAENIGMIERGDGAGFLLETAQAIGIGGEGGRKNFDGDIASETLIAGAVNLAHSASADGTQRVRKGQVWCRE